MTRRNFTAKTKGLIRERSGGCDLTPELVREFLSYEPKTGELIWRRRGVQWFPTEHQCNAWNAKHAGKKALAASQSAGYRHGTILDQKVYAHRVAWAHFYGEWPKNEIDHIDGKKANNRISNLRDVIKTENAKNIAKPTTNTSGIVGVRRCGRTGNWVASISVNNRHKHLGTFKTKADAAAKRKRAEAEFGYHANHGRAGR